MHLNPVHFAALGLMMMAAGCSREPTGQVAAVIGDDEVTLQEINAEIGNSQLPKGVDAKLVQQAALQRIVERRLFADIARDQDLDKKPDFLLRNRQLEDALLVQLLGEQLSRSIRVPEPAALDKFISNRSANFAGREILALDQIRFAMPADPSKLRSLEADKTLDSVGARLKGMGIEFERGGASLDTINVQPQTLAQINALPAGEPFVVPQGNVVTVSSIVGRKAAPLSGAQARPIAVQMIRNEELTKILQQRLKAKKAETEIEYKAGFGPPKPATKDGPRNATAAK